ncbi:MAG: VOC family protein [Meiothermus sp.]|uniref:VOC family protein n=1 Tax=Meiothermus sp. TaxID=1955249 RepID=UPI0025EDA588|nr:VOC family protein [Meiothermus sp.]MCS7057634.1 VOC family protein [Meiothermus sp.]MCS7193986.1 VOC family protein [Meiothermus sp.]MCX7741019.1 VOC family protein [Meiothermus sp.]MDW8090728.1 VOC family protein [Meiothermus sp.]MDW8480846.1 VOC family protein [Meiothermus sp.]
MRVHHIGIAVEDLEQAAAPYLQLGYHLEAHGRVGQQGVEVWMLRSGGSRLELVRAIRPDSAVARFVERHGPGLHHIALATPDLEAELVRLAAAGAPLVDPLPRPGFGGHRVAFIHPSWLGGVLLELVEEVEAPT